MKKITLAICLFISIASNSQIAQIFSNTTDTGFVAQVVDSTIIVKQNISININKIKTQGNDTLRIQLPGITTPVQIIKTRQSINNTLNSFEWFGEIQGSPNSFVLFTTVGSAVAGYIRDNNKIYRVQYKGNNVHQIASINNKYAKPDKVMHRGSIVDSSYTTDTASCCDTTKEVDVLVVYTVEAGRAAGGTDGMNATIDLCIELSNQSYINSGINVRQNLVHTEEINYADQNNAETNLSRITSNPGGIFNNVYTLRNTYSADIVVMMVDMMYGYSGIANVMTTNTVAFESNAFAIVTYGVSASNLVFTHEVGHLFGAGHETCDADWSGLYNYSHGHVGANYNTVMAGSPNFNRIEYWSNPDINYPADGLPTGISSGPCLSYNALTLNNTINTVSKFRCREGSLCKKPRKWYSCWLLWLSIALASVIFICWYLYKRRRRPSL